MSVILSAPGPIVVGLGLFLGRSSTQLADFFRRSAELLAIIVSLIIYKRINKHDHMEAEEVNKESLQKLAQTFVGLAMLISGLAMIFIALLGPNSEKGNVLPGLSIAFLGLTTNSWFWLRYTRLARQDQDPILLVQSRLYRAKSLVDGCVFLALLAVLLAPHSRLAHWADLGGSLVVSIYLLINGLMVLKDRALVLEQID